jgi:hypothetical protein
MKHLEIGRVAWPGLYSALNYLGNHAKMFLTRLKIIDFIEMYLFFKATFSGNSTHCGHVGSRGSWKKNNSITDQIQYKGVFLFEKKYGWIYKLFAFLTQ